MTGSGKNAGQRPDGKILRRTLFLMVVCGILAFVLLAVRLFQLMIVERDRLEEMAINQQTRETKVTANRGTIYDANGTVLAASATAYNVFISPREMELYGESPEYVARGLAQILDVSYESILSKTEDKSSWYQTVVTKIEPDLADKVREFKNAYQGKDLEGKTYTGLRSVHLEMDTKRYYPYGSLASHVMGFVGTDNYGLEGIEMMYNDYLEGTDGSVVRLAAGNGVELLFENYENYNDAVDGCDIYLTLDATIQGIVEKYLAQAMRENFIQGNGCVIAMEVKTGRILALANSNSYDPNDPFALPESARAELESITDPTERSSALTTALQSMWRNMAISDTYEPGSVFKPITISMGMEEGIISESDSFYCSGSIPASAIPGRTSALNCWKHSGHGSQTLKEALMHSCNVALANIAFEIGVDVFYDYVEAFGFWNKTGIDLSGEASTRALWWSEAAFKNPNDKSSLAAASFGQTFNTTPIQMITAFSSLVNGGKLMEPYIVDQVRDAEGNIVYTKEPTVVRQVLSAETSRAVASMLEAVVGEEEGTGKTAYVPGLHVGGKTGTTTDTVWERLYNEKKYMVSFCGVAPANDAEIAVIMVLDDPSQDSGIYVGGGVMVGPYVGKIFSEIMPYWGTEPDYNEVERGYLDVQVPNVTGNSVADARAKLEARGFTVAVVGGEGTITAQLPAANVEVATGTRVIIYAGGDAPATTARVPDLSGMTAERAKAVLTQAGLFLQTSGALPTSSNIVVQKQSVATGEEVPYGSIIKVTLADKTSLGQY